MTKRTYAVREAAELSGVSEPVIFLYVERQWISPAEPTRFDEEDLARLLLIRDLEELGVNREGVEIILHMRRRQIELQQQMDALCAALKDELRVRLRDVDLLDPRGFLPG